MMKDVQDYNSIRAHLWHVLIKLAQHLKKTKKITGDAFEDPTVNDWPVQVHIVNIWHFKDISADFEN